MDLNLSMFKGNALYAQGKYDGAVKCYSEAIRIDPKSYGLWWIKGKALYMLGKYDEAIKAYDKAIELDPNYANAWNGKGLALDNQDKHEEALKAFDRAIELDPNFAMAWNNKGKLFGLYIEIKRRRQHSPRLGICGIPIRASSIRVEVPKI
jgi:tetratricopeptide (TPR) repeat protein